MTVKEFRKTDMCKGAKSIKYLNIFDQPIIFSDKSKMDDYLIIGSAHAPHGRVEVTVQTERTLII